jgi:signal transduction histidine kinase
MERRYEGRRRTSSSEGPIRVRTGRRFRLLPGYEAAGAAVEYVHRVSRIPITRDNWFDVLIGVLAVSAMLEVGLYKGSPGAPTTTLWFCIPAIAVQVTPVFLRHRFPFAGPFAYWFIAIGISLIDWQLIPYPISLFVVGMATAFLLGNLRNDVQAVLGLGAAIAGSGTVVYLIHGHSTAQLIFIPLEFAVSWLAGFAVREQTEQAESAEVRAALAERERDAAARVAVAEERSRIARELHDIVAHAVSVMVLQVGAVRHRLPASEDSEALKGVEQAGRTALAEMRRLLAAMRSDGDGDDVKFSPQPGLDGLDVLLQQTGRAGLPARLHVDGDPFPLPRGIDLSAYRIVQEGLTNALKHARATIADVTVRYLPEELQLEVRDDGKGASSSDGLGHGLIGVRERVKIYGGEMSAGTANGRGFVLSARLPVAAERT